MKRKDKILMLTWEYPPNLIGGLARHVHGLSVALAKRGMEIHLITASVEGAPREEKNGNLTIYRVNPLNEHEQDFLLWIGGLNLAMVEKGCELADEHSFSLIHAHDWLVSGAAIALKEKLKCPLVSTIHATEYGRNCGIFTEMQKFIHEKENLLVEHSSHIIVCSNYMVEEVTNLFQVEREKVTPIPNGIHMDDMNAMSKPVHLPLPKGKIVFSIGRIVYEKGFDLLIEAAHFLKEKYDQLYFIIAGSGPLLDEYRQRVKKNHLDHIVQFPGYVDDHTRLQLLQKCDIAVFPSRYEPFGIVALESLYFGKPTIVANVGGLKEIIQHGKTGLIMEKENVQSLMTQIEFLLTNHEKGKKIGFAGKKMVEKTYHWSNIAKETMNVYSYLTRTG